jgi:hypothetical protein
LLYANQTSPGLVITTIGMNFCILQYTLCQSLKFQLFPLFHNSYRGFSSNKNWIMERREY